MRFIVTVALKYLVPRWRQLSASIISLVSLLVITLVVWLVIVFLSVTDGIEKNWLKQLVALNAPLKIKPTDTYYNSYYYQIDSLSSLSNFETKTIGEKLLSQKADPYDPFSDVELPSNFPLPDLHPDGSLKDLVKETVDAVKSLPISPRPSANEYEVSYGNLRLSLLRQEPGGNNMTQSYLSQVSYISSLDPDNKQFSRLLIDPSSEDLSNFLKNISQSAAEVSENEGETAREKLDLFLENVEVSALRTSDQGYRVPRTLFPSEGFIKGCGIARNGRVTKIIIPTSGERIDQLAQTIERSGHLPVIGTISFGEGRPQFIPDQEGIEIAKRMDFLLEPGVIFSAKMISQSHSKPQTLSNVLFEASIPVQNLLLQGNIHLDQLEIESVIAKKENRSQAPWISSGLNQPLTIPSNQLLGDGILVSKLFKDSGVRLGDTGFLSFLSQTAAGAQEQRLPIYVAGFYDPGFMPVGNRLIFADRKVTSSLRNSLTVADQLMGNGFNVWLESYEDAPKVKQALQKKLEESGLSPYWKVESYEDFEFARPVLQQLKSDKTLFTLIGAIILIVACSNIISMLILLVNDKKKEIGILQSLGASSKMIGSIFGVCGFMTGLLSSIFGAALSIYTLKHLQALVNLLSFLQGHPAFQSAFYGNLLPNELSLTAFSFVIAATILISLLAGIIPAIKAARIRPSEILRSE